MDFYTKIVQYKWLCKHFITIHKSKPVSLGLKALLKLYISSKSREWFQSSVVLTSHYGHMSAAGKEELGLVPLLGKPLAYLPKPLKGLDICLPVLDFIRAILVIASPLWVLLSLSLWVKGFGHTEWRTLLEDAFLGKRESTGKDLRTETGILITWNSSISLIITQEGKGSLNQGRSWYFKETEKTTWYLHKYQNVFFYILLMSWKLCPSHILLTTHACSNVIY